MEHIAKKYFKTCGPSKPDHDYMLPLPDIFPQMMRRIREGGCFAVHGPGRSGKTTLLQSLDREINGNGEFYSMDCNLSCVG